MVELLLDAEADAAIVTHDYNTPLHYFVRKTISAGNSEAIYLNLLDRLIKSTGDLINLANINGETVLHLASLCNNIVAVMRLLSFRANPNFRNKYVLQTKK